jgi:hypothetical protein
MRTTLTLDDDVAALLMRIQEQRKATMKEVVNAALRDGLVAMTKPPQPREPFRTGTLVNGPRNLPNIDNISEVLAWAEGEDYK